MRNRLAMLTGVVFILAGCNSETMAPAYVGVPGAGLKAEIVSVVAEPDGLLIKVSVMNLDTVMLGYGTTCNWQVEKLVGEQWTRIAGSSGVCDLTEVGLFPGQAYPQSYAIKSTVLVAGDQLRVVTDAHATAPITL